VKVAMDGPLTRVELPLLIQLRACEGLFRPTTVVISAGYKHVSSGQQTSPFGFPSPRAYCRSLRMSRRLGRTTPALARELPLPSSSPVTSTFSSDVNVACATPLSQHTAGCCECPALGSYSSALAKA